MTTPLIFNWSSGKDGAFAVYEIMQGEQYTVNGLLTTVTRDYGRISMHGVHEDLLDKQAESLDIPLTKAYISVDSSQEDYEEIIGSALSGFRDQGVFTVAFGDIFLADLKKYREEKLATVGMYAVFPVWERDTAELSRTFIDTGFKTIVTCVDTEMLDGSFSGREYNKGFLKDLPEGVDPCGENGEFHSFCYDGPIFNTPINIEKGESVLKHERFMFTELHSHKEH